MQLLRSVVHYRVVVGMRSDVGRKQIAIGRSVEFSLVADQDIDGSFEIGRSTEGIFKPDTKIVRRRRHALLRHRSQGFFRDSRRVLEINLVQRMLGHDVETIPCLASRLPLS
jgi:hypothetical protein